MRPITETIPKALIPVNGEPFADLQLRWLSAQGVRDVVYSVAYLGEAVEGHVGDGSRFGLRVRYVYDGERNLGTAGALRRVVDAGAVADVFGVINGDSFLSFDVAAVEAAFAESGCPALMTVMRNRNRWVPSNAVFRDGRVAVYDKSRPEAVRDEMEWIDYGYIVMRAALVGERVAAGEVADLADLMRDLSVEGRLAGFEVSERFYEVGSPEGLADLERHLAGGG